MPTVKVFNKVVAARGRAAQQILATPELVALFVAVGGLPADLDAVVAAGREAEANNLNQGSSFTDGKVATLAVQTAFAAIQREYQGVLGPLRAIQGALERSGAPTELITRLEEIIANRASVIVTEDVPLDGAKPAKKSAKRSESHESVRAEIERDATALLGFSEILNALKDRQWPVARVTKLQADARALSGKLGDRAAKKGAAKEASLKERQAVALQSSVWDSIYDLLASVARKDARVAVLLKEARQ